MQPLPPGLRGQQIPLSARILVLIDGDDAMASRRLYKPAIPHQQALVEMAKLRGSTFDPLLLDQMLACAHCCEEIHRTHADAESRPLAGVR